MNLWQCSQFSSSPFSFSFTLRHANIHWIAKANSCCWIGFNRLLKYIHAIQLSELGCSSSQSCKREKEREIRTPTNELVKEQWKLRITKEIAFYMYWVTSKSYPRNADHEVCVSFLRFCMWLFKLFPAHWATIAIDGTNVLIHLNKK